MLTHKMLVLAVVILSAMLCRGSLSHGEHSRHTLQEMQQLSASNRSTISDSFIFVARDVETYGVVRAAIPSLPDQPTEFFDSNVVVAIFLGQRPTSGYSIDVTTDADGAIRISERKPPPGAMLKMVLSAPHKVVAIPVKQHSPMSFVVDSTWQGRFRSYQVSSGEVTDSAESRKLTLTGKIEVMRAGDLATLFFEIQSKPASKNQRVFDVASLKLDSENRFRLARLKSFFGSTANPSYLTVDGQFALSGQELTLQFRSNTLSGSIKSVAGPAKSN